MKAAELRQSIFQMAFFGELTMDRYSASKKNKYDEAKIENFLAKECKPMATGPFGTMIKKHEHQSHGVPVLGIENIGEGKFIPGNKIFVTHEKAEYLKAFMLSEDDVIISRSGTVGKLCLVPKEMAGSLLSTNLMRVTLDKKKMDPHFFVYLFQSKGIIVDQVKELCRGSTRIFLNQTILKQLVFPFPSIDEQHRVVNKIDKLMIMCDQLEAAEKELDRLEENFIEYLPKSILQMAVQGKLVPQNLHDEPASELLARIRKKKIQLVKDGKFKKVKPQQLGLEESPYELPEGWIWCRLDEIADFKIGKTPARANDDYWENGIYPWVSIADMRSGEHLSGTKEKISQQAYNEVFKTTMVPKGSLLFSFKLSIGKVAILDMDAFTNEAICSITPFENSELIDYLFRVFPALDLLTDANDAIKGKTLNSKSIAKILIPLPPLAEQRRIVAKVDAFMDLYNELKETRNQPVLFSEENKVLHFPKKEEEEQILMVAQGAPSQKQSEELRQAIDDLFEDDGDE